MGDKRISIKAAAEKARPQEEAAQETGTERTG